MVEVTDLARFILGLSAFLLFLFLAMAHVLAPCALWLWLRRLPRFFLVAITMTTKTTGHPPAAFFSQITSLRSMHLLLLRV